MNEHLYKRNEALSKKVMKGLESRGMTAHYAADGKEALEIVLGLMPEGCSVTMGGSATAAEIGLMEAVSDGRYRFIDRRAAKTAEERRAVMIEGFDADFFITSTNAMTEDGELINIDGNANRVAMIAQGPKQVIVIAGMNKVAKDLDAAMKRARTIAAPVNCQRLQTNTPCVKGGTCFDCRTPDTICCQFLITRYSKHPGRIHVVLVNEELGF